MLKYNTERVGYNYMTDEERFVVNDLIERSKKIRDDIENIRKKNVIVDNNAYDALLEFSDELCDAESKFEKVLGE